MAGQTDSVPVPRTGMPEIVIDDPFAKMNTVLDRILASLTGRDPDAMQFDLQQNVGLDMHVRFRCDVFVFSGDSASIITLTIGTRTFTFNLPGADTRVVPFLVVVERGIDVTISASAGTCTGYLLGTRE